MKNINIIKIKYILLLIGSLILYSCEKIININLPYEGDKIVLNSLIQKDTNIFVRVTVSSPVQKESKFRECEGAKVDVYENEVLKETLTSEYYNNKLYYKSTFKAIEGAKYKFKVIVKGLDTVSCESILPPKPSFEVIGKDVASDESFAKIKIKIRDSANIHNYYRLRIYFAYKVQNEYSLFGTNMFTIEEFKENYLNEIVSGRDYDEIYFSDEKFDGKELTLTIKMTSWDEYMGVQLSNLSEESYKGLKAISQQSLASNDPFAEPVKVFSNVKGGYGLVAGIGDSTAVTQLK